MAASGSRSGASTPSRCARATSRSGSSPIFRRRTCAPRRRASARRSTRPRTCTRQPTTGVISQACSRRVPCSPRRSAGERPDSHEAHRRHGERRGNRVRRRGAPPARSLPARRPRPDGDARRLRHRQLRRVHGSLQRCRGEELHAARDPGRRRDDRDRRVAVTGRRADTAAAVLLRPPCAAVRLLHARDADEREASPRRESTSERGRDPQGDPRKHLPLHGVRQHRRGDQGGVAVTETTTQPLVVEKTETKPGFVGQNVPRKEDKRLVQGQGVFFDDVKRHGMGYVHFVRSPYAHAKIKSIDLTKALELGGVYGTLTGDEVAILTDPFFELSVKPGADIKDYALAVGRVRHVGEPVAAVVASSREVARDAADLVEVDYEPLPVVTTSEQALRNDTILHEDAGSNVVWQGVFDWGDYEGAVAEADHVVKIERLHFDRFSSTPLECSGVLCEYNRGTGQWTLYGNHQMPGVGAIWMAPALRTGIDKLRFVSQDIGGAFGNKICLHPQYVACCLLARKLNRPVQWTEWRTDQHTANAHGNERTFLDVEVPVTKDGRMLGLTVRVIDVVASELELDPVEVRKRNYVRADEMPYETPNGCVYDSGDYARCLDIALELIDHGTIEERRRDAEGRGKLLGVGIG